MPTPHTSDRAGAATRYLPPISSVEALRRAASVCRACPLWERGTQTVFGEGRTEARVMLVGEQPGDREDRTGRPFVGPAGRVLDRALHEAGIARDDAYVTNVVKHFKWEAQGKRRLHKRPNSTEIEACRPWLDAELELVRPVVVVLMGATAAQALLGRSFRVSRQRGELFGADVLPVPPWRAPDAEPVARWVTATIHPSSVLRARDDRARHEQHAGLVRDLAVVAGVLRDS